MLQQAAARPHLSTKRPCLLCTADCCGFSDVNHAPMFALEFKIRITRPAVIYAPKSCEQQDLCMCNAIVKSMPLFTSKPTSRTYRSQLDWVNHGLRESEAMRPVLIPAVPARCLCLDERYSTVPLDCAAARAPSTAAGPAWPPSMVPLYLIGPAWPQWSCMALMRLSTARVCCGSQ